MSLFEFTKALKNAKTLSREDAPALLDCVEAMSKKAGTRVAGVKLIETGIPNAAFHPVDGHIYVTEGLLHLMESSNMREPPTPELQAIIGHELGHARFRVKHTLPKLAIITALPAIAIGAYQIIDKTNRRVQQDKKEHPDHPKAFWKAFAEVTGDIMRNPGHAAKEYIKELSPSVTKMAGSDPHYKDMSWFDAYKKEAIIFAVQAAALVPALAACRPHVLRCEYEADRFAVALMGETKSVQSAFSKLETFIKARIEENAASPLQKTWGQKIMKVVESFFQQTIAAHPDMSKRIHTVSALDAKAAAASFGIGT